MSTWIMRKSGLYLLHSNSRYPTSCCYEDFWVPLTTAILPSQRPSHQCPMPSCIFKAIFLSLAFFLQRFSCAIRPSFPVSNRLRYSGMAFSSREILSSRFSTSASRFPIFSSRSFISAFIFSFSSSIKESFSRPCSSMPSNSRILPFASASFASRATTPSSFLVSLRLFWFLLVAKRSLLRGYRGC